jgi:hypothetical protein
MHDEKLPATEVIEPDHPEHIAQSIIPYNRDDAKARYLGLRASGFTIKEALSLIDTHKSTLSGWRREDEKFVELENDLPSLRKTLGLEYVALETLRNMRLVLEKDRRIIMQSLTDAPLSNSDQQYLLKLRSYYTPQQLQALEALIGNDTTGEKTNLIDFTEIIARRVTTVDEVGVRHHHQDSVLGKING